MKTNVASTGYATETGGRKEYQEPETPVLAIFLDQIPESTRSVWTIWLFVIHIYTGTGILVYYERPPVSSWD